MKRGEKGALWVIGAAVVGIVGLTTYMEVHTQKRMPHVTREAEMASAGVQTAAAAAIPVGIDAETLPEPGSEGAQEMVTYCVQCHGLPPPNMHTAEEWQDVLKRMERHIEVRRGGMFARVAMPSAQDWHKLREYLAAHSQKPLEPSRVVDLDTPAGQAFHATCSQCHAPPDPAQHTAREWASVVVRMKYNMESAGKPVPDDKTTELIVAFLRKNAAEEIATP